MDQNIDDSKSQIWNSFFKILRYYFGHTTFLYSSARSIGHTENFFWQKLAKKITHFTIQFRSKNLTYFTNLDLLTLKIICSRNAAKNLSDFKSFPADMFLLGIRENICNAFLKYFESKCLYISVYLRKKNFFPKT